jgi:nucleoside-diphosphate-sugar epimerase
MKLLITGAFGFVGTNLSIAFKTSLKHRLIAIDIAETGHHFFDEFRSWNDLEKVEWDKVDTIIHLAGKAHDTKNISSEQEYFDINVGLTQKIFQYFLKSSATKFIFFSSVKAVADSVNDEHLTEEALANPQTAYGKSKLEAENYILNELEKWKLGEGEKVRNEECENRNNATKRLHDFTNEGEHNEKKVYILRPCMIHGPGNKGNLNLLYKISQKGYPWPLGAFENKRSFCSIDNVLFVIQQLIEKDIEPGVYQVADDEALSTNKLIELIASSQNKKAKIWHIPVRLIKTVARVGDFSYLPLNSERLKKLTESYVVSNQKIKKALGIEKMPFSAKDGFKKTFETFRKG